VFCTKSTLLILTKQTTIHRTAGCILYWHTSYTTPKDNTFLWLYNW